MYFRERPVQKPLRIRDPPLHRSSSVSAIIHGGPQNKCNHYVDALQRFQRDHATVDRQQRQKKHHSKELNYQKRRQQTLQREQKIKKNEQQNIERLLQRQRQSQMLHELGAKKTAHTYSIPVNPINSRYEQNERGRYQAHIDEDRLLNKLVRAHHITTCGNSGYNLINGQASTHIDELVPKNSKQIFEHKLSNYYSQFRLDPNSNVHPDTRFIS